MTLVVDIDQFCIFVFPASTAFWNTGARNRAWYTCVAVVVAPSRIRPNGFGIACF